MKPLLFALLLMLSGCGEIKPPESSIKVSGFYRPILVDSVRIDGCQYLILNASYTLTHKGNCNNPIHRHSYSDTLDVIYSHRGLRLHNLGASK